jgi:hypothetical protein
MPDSTQYPTGRKRKGRATKAKANGANLGFEEKLWLTADKLRGHLDPADSCKPMQLLIMEV